MARGGLVNESGTCVAVVQAASGPVVNYAQNADKSWLSFIPDLYCNVGDHWTGSAWLYAGTTPPAATPAQVVASFNLSGFGGQLQTAILAAAVAEQNIWQPPMLTASDPVIAAAAVAIPLTAAQVRSLLQQATTL